MKLRKYLIKLNLLICIALILSISCKQLAEMRSFSKCEFRLRSIELLSLDNIDISGIKTINDIDAVTMLRLSNSLLSGKMPISFRTNIEAKNPNQKKASMNRFEMQILFNNIDLAHTVMSQRVEIIPGQIAVIPLTVNSDLGQIMKGKNIRDVLSLLFTGSDTPAVFTVKIKPSVYVGPVPINYPGYITLSKNFKSQ